MRVIHADEIRSYENRPLPAIAVLAILLILGGPATAEAQDGILDEVRTMLEAGMSEPIILQWLEGSEKKPPRPSAVELIGLKEAGASDELLARLLELADVGAHGMHPPEPAPAAEPEAVVQPSTPAAPTAEPRPAAPVETTAVSSPPAASKPATAEPPATAANEVPVYFELSYFPDFDEDEDEWGLYVYLDGEPLTYVPAGSILSSKPLRFRQLLAPGSHTLRVAQEQHVKRGRDRWLHAARMSELELPLALATGERADAELKFRQSRLAFGRSEGPLSFRLVQGKNVEVIEKQGGDPEAWTLVCEEIEANAEEGKVLKKSLRRQLDACSRWTELWGDLEVPGRDEVREALALFRYRPTPKDQPLD